MSYQVRKLPDLVAQSTGTNTATNGIGAIDDASAITFWFTSSANAASTGTGLFLQVSMFDPSLITSAAGEPGVLGSTVYQMVSSVVFSTGAGLITSSFMAYTIPFNNMGGWRGLRLTGYTSAASGEILAHVTKMIQV